MTGTHLTGFLSPAINQQNFVPELNLVIND